MYYTSLRRVDFIKNSAKPKVNAENYIIHEHNFIFITLKKPVAEKKNYNNNDYVVRNININNSLISY